MERLRERRLVSRDAGFSMVELMVAMLIIGIVLLVLVAVQVRAAVVVTEARKAQQATAFANEAVEEMRSIPWNTLSRGLASTYLTASGGDPLVAGGKLKVDGQEVTLIVAPVASDQNYVAKPVTPLFDKTGSNVQVRNDPSLVGVDFTLKAYVYDPNPSGGGGKNGIVGIAVVVEWSGPNGVTSRTTVWSKAYGGSAGPCGDGDTQPFLAACQSFFEASATSGHLTVGISAINNMDDSIQPLTFPGTSDAYTLEMRTADASANIRSQQVSYAQAVIDYGGTTVDDLNAAVPPTEDESLGHDVYSVLSSDDVTQYGSGLLNVALGPVTQTADDELDVSHSSSQVKFWTRSDWRRTGSGKGSMNTSCMTGIPNNSPCAWANLANDGSSYQTGAGYLLMEVHGQTFRLSRRLSESSGENSDVAWAARFVKDLGSVDTGCNTLSGPGCVGAGATRKSADLSIGAAVTPATSWSGGAAPNGMVVIKGGASCTRYTDSVEVQRGKSQTGVDPKISRCGGVMYWNGTAYETLNFTETTPYTVRDTGTVSWTSGDGSYTVTASTKVEILPGHFTEAGPTDCVADACTVVVSAGEISVTSTYVVDGGGNQVRFVVNTTITSPTASASYKAALSGG